MSEQERTAAIGNAMVAGKEFDHRIAVALEVAGMSPSQRSHLMSAEQLANAARNKLRDALAEKEPQP